MNWVSIARQIRSEPAPLLSKWKVFVEQTKLGWKGQGKDDLHLTDWQWKDTSDFLTSNKLMYWDWCRDSGKTMWMALVAIFLTVIGKNCYWFAPTSNQFKRFQQICNFCPFVVPKKATLQRREIELINGDLISMIILDDMEDSSGPHPDAGFFDEIADMSPEILQNCMYMFNPDSWIAYISTPRKGSATSFVRKMEGISVRTHTYLDCKWKDHKAIEKMIIPGQEHLFKQNQMCMEVLAEGVVFQNIELMNIHDHPTLFDPNGIPYYEKFLWVRQGIDNNGMKNRNICIRIGEYNNRYWILKEEAFAYKLEDALLQIRAREFPTEQESGWWNDTFAPNLVGVTKMDFAENKGQAKIDRVIKLQSKPIMIDPAISPHLLDDFYHCVWVTSPSGEKVDTNPYHYLAGALHAIGYGEGILDIPQPLFNPMRARIGYV